MDIDLSPMRGPIINMALNLLIVVVVTVIFTFLVIKLLRIIRVPDNVIQRLIPFPVVVGLVGSIMLMDKYSLFIG